MTKTVNAAAAPSSIAPVAESRATASRADETLTPAGLQSMRVLAWRRATMLALCLATMAVVLYGVASLLSAGGWTVIDIGIFLTVLISAPWTVLGFWNAAIGLWLLGGVKNPFALVSPFLVGAAADRSPVTSRVAVFMTLRNEDPERAFQRLIAMRRSLDDTGEGRSFDVFVLSDSDDIAICAQEERLFDANKAALSGLGAARYRRRDDNVGFKAGNVEDFLDEYGDGYDLMIPLDADSVMSGGLMVRMVRIAEHHPKIGILQSLGVGAPAESPFARIFQFGMRHGMRSFTMGSAWCRAIAVRSGATTPSCASRRSKRIARCRCCAGRRRSAGISSAMIRSRRR